MSEKSSLEKLVEKKFSYKAKAVASLGVCFLGAVSMYVTNGETGIGWAILGLMFIWG